MCLVESDKHVIVLLCLRRTTEEIYAELEFLPFHSRYYNHTRVHVTKAGIYST